MKNPSFFVKAIWDEDARVFYSESDITGLHIEAATIEEFESEMMVHAPQMVLENHVTKRDLEQRSLLDLIPSIFFRQQAVGGAVAA
jgi:hypothetical protein